MSLGEVGSNKSLEMGRGGGEFSLVWKQEKWTLKKIDLGTTDLHLHF